MTDEVFPEFEESKETVELTDELLEALESLKMKSEIEFFLKNGSTFTLKYIGTSEDFVWVWGRSKRKVLLFTGKETFFELRKKEVVGYIARNI